MNELLLVVWGHTHTHTQNDFSIVFILKSFTHSLATLRPNFVVLQETFPSCRDVIKYKNCGVFSLGKQTRPTSGQIETVGQSEFRTACAVTRGNLFAQILSKQTRTR